MGTKWNRYKACGVIFLLLMGAPQAYAQQAPLSPFILKARYSIAWSGIPLGRIRINVTEDATSYRISIDTKTKGVGALVSSASQMISAYGKKNAAGEYLAQHYQSSPHKPDEQSDIITLTYDANGHLASRTRTQDDNPAHRPPVPAAEADTAHDPVTAAFILRQKLYAALDNPAADISTRTYDGMRLATMRLIREADQPLEIMDKKVEAITLAITRTPINGYTNKELKKYQKGDPAIHIYFSNDEAFLPIRASAKTLLGEMSMTLEEKE